MFLVKKMCRSKKFIAVCCCAFICWFFFCPKTAMAEANAHITAPSLAATGDVVAAVAIAVGAIAAFALTLSIVSKKRKNKNKCEWKYPF